MKSFCAICVSACFAFMALADQEYDIARQALRDGIWSVARDHALHSNMPEGRLLVLESYAHESRWQDVLSTLESWGFPEGEAFLCYRAKALAMTGDGQAARKLLADAKFADKSLTRLAARINAEILIKSGNYAEALKALDDDGVPDADSMMLKAEALAGMGEKKDAAAIWREIVASTNAADEAVAAAASNLGEVEPLRAAYAKMNLAALRRSVGIRLGIALLREKATFNEGSRLIQSIVRDAPDADGAKEGLMALADGLLDRKAWSAAADVYEEILETWPSMAKDAAFQEGRGWAFSELGRLDEAFDAFDRAFELAQDDASKSMALVKAGDVLAALGRGDEAMSRYRKVREEFPKTLAAERIAGLVRLHELEEKGRAQYGEYRFADALKTFQQVADESPSRRSKMRFYIVMCLYGQGLDEEAAAQAKSLAEDNTVETPLRAEAELWLAKYAYNRSRWQDAAFGFLTYADLVPKSSFAPAAVVWGARAYFADNDFTHAISTATRLADMQADQATLAAGLLVQGESLIELARFDEAVLVLERAALAAGMLPDERFRAQLLKADALFAMGADNSVRYIAALDAYRTLFLGADMDPTQKISLAFKIGKTLERLKRTEEAIDQYYTQVVLAYCNGRQKGVAYGDSAHADFSRAAFRLAEEYESRGQDEQAVNILSLVVACEVPSADEASRRINRIRKKGKFL